MNIWRELDPKEEQEFRRWARENYKLGEPVDELWHPVVRDEISKMAHEKLGLEDERIAVMNFLKVELKKFMQFILSSGYLTLCDEDWDDFIGEYLEAMREEGS